jgi:phosphopantothenoylcysteine synthetase/decarboxylase
LRTAGHQVVTPADAGLAGVSDPRHLTHTVQQHLVLLTRNHDDFEDLHLVVQATGGNYPGLLVVRSDNDPSRDMKDRDIARAIANLERAGVPVTNEFHVLNH